MDSVLNGASPWCVCVHLHTGMDRDVRSMVPYGSVPGHSSQPGCGFVGGR